ncbi:MAG TPA: DNA replication and repair protein RecF [Acidimicrobiales bacterium]|nr:DNA replication and repair protein RecF [Acidimicrobiales bacterium]
MFLEQFWLRDFRSYHEAHLQPATDGLTVVTGDNGAGKTNLLEAVAYLATMRSFRGASTEAMVRDGAPRAVVRGEGHGGGRRLLIEGELNPAGRDRVQVNRQPLRRSADLLEGLRVTVFTPDDLTLVKGGPQGRRDLLDDLLESLHPRHRQARGEVERVLRQRAALLRSAGGNPRPPADVVTTLDVWDAKLAAAGEALVGAREGLAAALSQPAAAAYRELASAAGGRGAVALRYLRSWQGSLASALAAGRGDDLRRGVNTVGPHRDELVLEVGGMPARTHASQGEQRSLALALRLAGHAVVSARVGSPPVLLLDDVFSELDARRSAALVALLPAGQALLTTAGGVPAGTHPEQVVRVAGGTIVAGGGRPGGAGSGGGAGEGAVAGGPAGGLRGPAATGCDRLER